MQKNEEIKHWGTGENRPFLCGIDWNMQNFSQYIDKITCLICVKSALDQNFHPQHLISARYKKLNYENDFENILK
jgi:hypothetical protein